MGWVGFSAVWCNMVRCSAVGWEEEGLGWAGLGWAAANELRVRLSGG